MADDRAVRRTGLAVIGLAGRFPGADSPQELWRRLCAGDELVSFFSEPELIGAGVDPAVLADPAYVPAAGVLDGIENFDAGYFGYPPREATLMDPQHRVFLECACQALLDAGYDPARYPGRIGVYAGASTSSYLLNHLHRRPDVLADADPFQVQLGNDRDFLATRVSYKLDLRGPSVTVGTACSTSLVAVHLAGQALLTGDADLALAGGVCIRTPQRRGYLHRPGGLMSPDGHCRAFDHRAAGTVGGSGAGVVVLKRLAEALADRDHVYAVLAGSAVNNDGAGRAGFAAPAVEGQAEVVAEALAMAGVTPAQIGYVEAHGTGTPLGDPIEVAALTQAFGAAGPPGPGSVLLGSVKTNLGHLDTAAGITGLIKTVLAVHYGQLPPSLHFEKPNPGIDFATGPFRVNTELSAWPRRPGPRRAGVSSFGVGGTNAHVIVEQAPPLAQAPRPAPAGPADRAARRCQVLVLSAASPAALHAARHRLARHLAAQPGQRLADVAYTLQVGRPVLAYRAAVVCDSTAAAVAALVDDPAAMPRAALDATATALDAAAATAAALDAAALDDAAPAAALGRLWTEGVPVDWDTVHCGEELFRVPLPGYPFERARYWVEPAAEPAAAPVPAGTAPRHPRPALRTAYRRPEGPLERQIAAVWEDHFAIAPVGLDDDFFELGGDSLLAAEIVGRLRGQLATELPLEAMFEAPTVAELAARVRAAQTPARTSRAGHPTEGR